jgi:membrane protease YdiL (CAAX protease family)
MKVPYHSTISSSCQPKLAKKPKLHHYHNMTKTPLLAELLTFLKSPKYEENQKQTFLYKLIHLFRISFLAIFISTLLSIIIAFLSSQFKAVDTNAVSDLINTAPAWKIFLLAGLAAPITEEIGFRLWLTKKPILFSIGFTGLLYFYSTLFTDNINTPNLLIYYILGVISVFAATLFTITRPNFKPKFNQFFTTRFSWLFYLSTFLFAIIHISNYQASPIVFALLPILVLPQFIGGLMIAYNRVKLGFIWGIFTHFLYNSLLLFPALALKFLSPQAQNIIQNKGETTTLAIQDQAYLIGISLYVLALIAIGLSLNLWLLIEYFQKPTKSQKQA